MTRALRLRSSKRKLASSSQEFLPKECKENSPSILSQSTLKKTRARTKPCTGKENVSPQQVSSKCSKSPVVLNNNNSPIRKSTRRIKVNNKLPENPLTSVSARSVLFDKTNSLRTREGKLNEQTSDLLKSAKKYNLNKLISPPVLQTNSSIDNHVPIYKTVGSQEASENGNLPPEKKETVYEFEVDENEEPVQKKKRKKNVSKRKPKTGAKALTINNIKYSSTESLATLPDRPIAQKKRATKGRPTKLKANLKPYSSVTNLNNSDESSYSVKSFMSHPPSVLLNDGQKPKSNRRLSVLQETLSEQLQSPIHQVEADVHVDCSNDPEPLINESNSSLRPSNTMIATPRISTSNQSHSSIPKCYVSKFHRTPKSNALQRSHYSTSNNTIPLQLSYSANVSTSSSHDLRSSTPKPSLVICNNSVFDDSYECDFPRNLQPSPGFVKDASVLANDENNCFGFDEPEELEEPLVSPIKSSIDLKPKKPVKLIPRKLEPTDCEVPKPSAKEVIEILKATLAKSAPKEETEVFDTSSVISTSAAEAEEEIAEVTFKMPPRRSYERQRRVRYHSEHEEESEEEKSEEEEKPKAVKKCYRHKKANTTKSGRAPKGTKQKQKMAKQEEELERLAAQMNAQFQKIEQVSLVVE